MSISLSVLERWLSRLHIHQRGRLAERLVMLTYLCHGYRPLRVRLPIQIDLIMRRRAALVLIEVKYRRHALYRPVALRPAQARRLHLAARMLAGQYPYTHVTIHCVSVGTRWPFMHTVNLSSLA